MTRGALSERGALADRRYVDSQTELAKNPAAAGLIMTFY
jgi:hypothetical protein